MCDSKELADFLIYAREEGLIQAEASEDQKKKSIQTLCAVWKEKQEDSQLLSLPANVRYQMILKNLDWDAVSALCRTKAMEDLCKNYRGVGVWAALLFDRAPLSRADILERFDLQEIPTDAEELEELVEEGIEDELYDDEYSVQVVDGKLSVRPIVPDYAKDHPEAYVHAYLLAEKLRNKQGYDSDADFFEALLMPQELADGIFIIPYELDDDGDLLNQANVRIDRSSPQVSKVLKDYDRRSDQAKNNRRLSREILALPDWVVEHDELVKFLYKLWVKGNVRWSLNK